MIIYFLLRIIFLEINSSVGHVRRRSATISFSLTQIQVD